jgi:XRE family transcriptional regulator, regulator of sulfur utilization
VPRDAVPNLPDRLRQLREAAGLTLDQLARAANTSLYSVSKFERGERLPSLPTAYRLADALGVTVDSLRTAAVNPPPARGRGAPKKLQKN